MGKQKKFSTYIAIFLIVLVSENAATADNIWDAISILCLPEVNYFYLQTLAFPISRRDKNSVDRYAQLFDVAKSLEMQRGLYKPIYFVKNSYSCDLSGRLISVELRDYVAPKSTGECGLLESFRVIILINGKLVHNFPAYGLNRCTAPEHHIIDLDYLGNLTDCTIFDGLNHNLMPVCENSKTD